MRLGWRDWILRCVVSLTAEPAVAEGLEQGRVTWVNASWREITKHPPELRLDEWARGVDPEDYEALAELWAV